MSPKFACGFCKKEISGHPGILFSPPNKAGSFKKHDLCNKCYKEITKIIRLEISEIEDVLSLGPAWLNYTRKVKRKGK